MLHLIQYLCFLPLGYGQGWSLFWLCDVITEWLCRAFRITSEIRKVVVGLFMWAIGFFPLIHGSQLALGWLAVISGLNLEIAEWIGLAGWVYAFVRYRHRKPPPKKKREKVGGTGMFRKPILVQEGCK